MNSNKPESRIFLIADTHFGDENIRLYEERPFPDTEEIPKNGRHRTGREVHWHGRHH
jgi:hypothetical protein